MHILHIQTEPDLTLYTQVMICQYLNILEKIFLCGAYYAIEGWIFCDFC